MFVTIAVVLWKILNRGYSQNFFKEESSKADFETGPESLLRLQIPKDQISPQSTDHFWKKTFPFVNTTFTPRMHLKLAYIIQYVLQKQYS